MLDFPLDDYQYRKILAYLNANLTGPQKLAFEYLRLSLLKLQGMANAGAAKTQDEKAAIAGTLLGTLYTEEASLRELCASLGVDLSETPENTPRPIREDTSVKKPRRKRP